MDFNSPAKFTSGKRINSFNFTTAQGSPVRVISPNRKKFLQLENDHRISPIKIKTCRSN